MHAWCGKRPGETDRSKDQHRAPGRFHHDRVGRSRVTGSDEFRTKVIEALRRLQKMPHIVRAFFASPDLRYTTA